MLDVLGLTPAEMACYEALVRRGVSCPVDVAAAVDQPVDTVRRQLEHLVQRGLATRPGRAEQFVAAPPLVALGALIVERESALRDASQQMNALHELYQSSSRNRNADEIIDVVQGAEAVRQRFTQLQRGARERLRYFVLPDVLVLPYRDNAEDRQATLDRGVRIEVVAETEALADPEFLEVARAQQTSGYELRIVPSLPTRIMIVDDELALLPISPRRDVEAPGAMVIRASGLLAMLSALFERTWQAAAPATVAADLSTTVRGSELDPVDYDLLRLLDLGVTDRVVAQQLHLSIRTVQRRVSTLMDLAMVSSRYQLGRAAHARGWL